MLRQIYGCVFCAVLLCGGNALFHYGREPVPPPVMTFFARLKKVASLNLIVVGQAVAEEGVVSKHSAIE